MTAKDLELPDFLKVGSPIRSSPEHSTCGSTRKRERRNSDSSLMDFMSEGSAKQHRSLAQEALDLNSSTYSIHSSHNTSLPFSNRSFSQDGVVPGHAQAEQYFSGLPSEKVDFNDCHMMDRSITDLGFSHQRIPEIMKSSRHAHTPIHQLPVKLSPRAKTLSSDKILPPPPPEFYETIAIEGGLADYKPPTPLALSRAPLRDTQNITHPSRTAKSQPPKHLHIRGQSNIHPAKDSNTPSPTTHDLILDPHSSPEVLPTKSRSSAKKSLHFSTEAQSDEDDDMQISFV